jgi:hypothetical protein
LGYRLKIMPITINGSGTVTGISAGGLPDGCIVTADIADNNVTTAKIDNISVTEIKIADNNVTTTKIADANVTAAKLSGVQTGSAPIYGCRAWVNFDGTRNEADTGASTNGANVKIRASGNVTSVLKNATGDYTVTFTTAMSDANYCTVLGGNGTAGSVNVTLAALHPYNSSISSATTASVRVLSLATGGGSGTTPDMPFFNVAIFR